MPIDLYLMNLSPPCRAVLMVAKQLNIELNLIPTKSIFNLGFVDHLKSAHTVPTIVDDGFVLWESRAIIQYLCNKYAPESDLYPSDPKERAQVDRNLNFDMKYYISIREALIIPNFRGTEPSEEKIEVMNINIKLLDTTIGDNKYVTGDNLTIADLSILASSTVFHVIEYDLTEYPKVKSWYDRLATELPYFDDINGKVKDEMKDLMAVMNFIQAEIYS